MPAEIVAAVMLLMCVMVGSISAQWWRARQSSLRVELSHRGVTLTGRVVAINRPIGLPHETHVYFTYEPPGAGSLLQSCCVDMRALREQHAVEIPNVGAAVAVRYLPEAPTRAVITQLLPCIAGSGRATQQQTPAL